jgi:hypothetical protein
MCDLQDRAVGCLAPVFPALASDKVHGVRCGDSSAQESLPTVTLTAAVGQEISMEIYLIFRSESFLKLFGPIFTTIAIPQWG